MPSKGGSLQSVRVQDGRLPRSASSQQREVRHTRVVLVGGRTNTGATSQEAPEFINLKHKDSVYLFLGFPIWKEFKKHH